MVICLERDADLHMAQLMPLLLTVSCFSKIQIDFTFLVPAHPGSPGKRAVKRCVCVLEGAWRIGPRQQSRLRFTNELSTTNVVRTKMFRQIELTDSWRRQIVTLCERTVPCVAIVDRCLVTRWTRPIWRRCLVRTFFVEPGRTSIIIISWTALMRWLRAMTSSLLSKISSTFTPPSSGYNLRHCCLLSLSLIHSQLIFAVLQHDKLLKVDW